VADPGERRIVAGAFDPRGGARDRLHVVVGVLGFEVGAALRQRLGVGGDGVEVRRLRQQGVADRRDDLLGDRDFRVGDGVERLSDAALDAVLDRDDAAFVLVGVDRGDDRRHRLPEHHVVVDRPRAALWEYVPAGPRVTTCIRWSTAGGVKRPRGRTGDPATMVCTDRKPGHSGF